MISEWNKRVKFNGFFFGLNMAVVSSCEYNTRNLFNPERIMVGQEDDLMVTCSASTVRKLCLLLFCCIL